MIEKVPPIGGGVVDVGTAEVLKSVEVLWNGLLFVTKEDCDEVVLRGPLRMLVENVEVMGGEDDDVLPFELLDCICDDRVEDAQVVFSEGEELEVAIEVLMVEEPVLLAIVLELEELVCALEEIGWEDIPLVG